jgi:hypothetical protein
LTVPFATLTILLRTSVTELWISATALTLLLHGTILAARPIFARRLITHITFHFL